MKKATGILLAAVLTACGGGGGGNQGGDNTGLPPVVKPDPGPGGTGDSSILAFDPPRLEAIAIQGEPLKLQVVGTASLSIQEQLNLRLEASSDFSTEVTMERLDSHRYLAQLKTAENGAPGVRSGFINVSLCRDDPKVCASPYPGSPWKLPYQLNILSTADNLKPLGKLEGASDWSNVQGNAGHTGRVETSTRLDPANFSLRWMRSAPAGNQGIYNEVLVKGSRVFYNSQTLLNKVVMALDEKDGSVAWSQSLDLIGNPVLSAGYLVAQTKEPNSSLTKLMDLQTGKVVLQENISRRPGTNFSWLTGDDHSVYPSNPLRRVDTKTAKPQWEKADNESGMLVLHSPLTAIDTKHVYAILVRFNHNAYPDQFLEISRIDDGSRVALIADPQPFTNDFVAGAPGISVLDGADRVVTARHSAGNGSISSFSISQNKRLWTKNLSFHSAPVVSNGVVYLAAPDPNSNIATQLHAYDGDTGSLLWSMRLPNDTVAPYRWGLDFGYQIIAINNLLFISSVTQEKGNRTYAIDPATRKIVWQFPSAGRLSASANGLLHIARPDGKLLAVHLN